MTTLPQLIIPGLSMSEDDAFAEARRRWGANAFCQVRYEDVPGPPGARWDTKHGPPIYQVGVLFMRATNPGDWMHPQPVEDWRCYGEGECWEGAFKDADRNAHRRGGL